MQNREARKEKGLNMIASKNAIIYSRAAGAGVARKSDAIVSQEERCREYALQRGYNVVAEFWDLGSGTIERRPGLDDMLDFLVEHRIDAPVVIVDCPSRLARDVATYTKIRNAIVDRGAILKSPSFTVDGKTAGGALVESLLPRLQ